MSYVIRHGRSFWLQPCSDGKTVRWGDRRTALVYATENEAFCVAAFLFGTGHYEPQSLTVEALYQDFKTVPVALVERLQECCLRVMNPCQISEWRGVWRRFALLAGDDAQEYLTGREPVRGALVLDIDIDLLKDLQQCAAIVATPWAGDPVAQAEFASKTLQLSLNYHAPQEID